MAVETRYYPAKLHLHSCFESSASMGGHCFQAKKLGVEVIWITDHDTRICWRKSSAFWVDDFEREQLSIPGKKGRFDGWRVSALDDGIEGGAELVDYVSLSGKRSMRVWAKSTKSKEEWGSLRVDFSTSGKRHQRSLMVGVSISLAIKPICGLGENGRLRIHVKLSQQPPDFDKESITYVIGGSTQDNGHNFIQLNDLKMKEWNILYLNLSGDAQRYAKGGLDNVFEGLSLFLDSRRGEFIELYIDDFRLSQAHNCQAAFDLQKRMALELSNRYGVMVFIGMELSASKQHMCAFGSWVPVIDLNSRPNGYTIEEAVAHVKAHGGAISLCHPFSKWKREELTEREKDKVVQTVMDLYKEKHCFGAHLLEVGFPEGRHGFSLKHYLDLWDGLSRAGIVITGIGVSDAHNNLSGWESGNNFVNWIRSKSLKEKDLIQGLLSGDVYMGDPTVFHGNLEFTTVDGYRMGQIIVGKKHPEILLRISNCRPGWKVHWIVNGERKAVLSIYNETFEFKSSITIHGFSFTRFEIYDENGRCILLTNPIYFTEKLSPNLPRYRVVKFFNE